MIVCKFGGTSTTSLKSIQNIKALKEKNKKRQVFVFSAIGKKYQKDKKITDLLIEITQNKNVSKNKKLILNKFNKLQKDLKININVKKLLNKYYNYFSLTKNTDYLISKGEYITTLLMSKYLDIKFIPAEKIIFFQNNKINYKRTKNKLIYYKNKYKIFATCGFYGANENKQIKLFSRGGSDITGAIIAKCLNANIYENWTDVYGVRQVNPKITNSKQIKRMSYADLDIMTRCDANVIHNDCIEILYGEKIKLKVGNIFDIKSKKTIVVDRYKKVKFVCYKIDKDKVIIVYRDKKLNLVKNECELSNYKENILKIYKKLY